MPTTTNKQPLEDLVTRCKKCPLMNVQYNYDFCPDYTCRHPTNPAKKVTELDPEDRDGLDVRALSKTVAEDCPLRERGLLLALA